MDLSTTWLGLRLAHPYMAGASPLSGDLDSVRRLEDGGASALVLPSLFEEQVTLATRGEIRNRDILDDRFRTQVSPFPAADAFALSPDAYLEHLRRVKDALRIPVFASLNGTTSDAWLRFALDVERAGADGLELNMYDIVSDPRRSSLAVETDLRNLVREMKHALRIPVAMKLSPHFTAPGNLVRRLDEAHVDGLVLFNRSYLPDIDLASLSMVPRIELSTHAELPLRLHWIALLHGRVRASLALTGGVATPADGVKALLTGADAVQMVSAVLRDGPGLFGRMRDWLATFMAGRGFTAVSELKGRVSFSATDDPAAVERAGYLKTLQSWDRPEEHALAPRLANG